jgi:hypothetical protein
MTVLLHSAILGDLQYARYQIEVRMHFEQLNGSQY